MLKIRCKRRRSQLTHLSCGCSTGGSIAQSWCAMGSCRAQPMGVLQPAGASLQKPPRVINTLCPSTWKISLKFAARQINAMFLCMVTQQWCVPVQAVVLHNHYKAVKGNSEAV